MIKNPKNHLRIILKSRIFWHAFFKKNNIVWILQVCRILKDFGLYF